MAIEDVLPDEGGASVRGEGLGGGVEREAGVADAAVLSCCSSPFRPNASQAAAPGWVMSSP